MLFYNLPQVFDASIQLGNPSLDYRANNKFTYTQKQALCLSFWSLNSWLWICFLLFESKSII